MLSTFKIFPPVSLSSIFSKGSSVIILNAVVTIKERILKRVWCQAKCRWDIHRVVMGDQLGILCVLLYYCMFNIHANSKQIVSLHTCGEELEYLEDTL